MSHEILEGPCFRENCNGPMELKDGIYICKSCGLGASISTYTNWLHKGGGNNDYEDDYVGVPGWDELYDEDGEFIFCPNCIGSITPLKMHNEKIMCPRCGFVVNDETFIF